ncbi:SPT2-domain-containing protein [Marasmius fiardii PR-910]|nr:SPT2-domain-containing protein [Marasmius fiardii PR-910]
MSSFSALMALSATQTSSQQASVQKALEERQRKEREQRKKAEEQEKKQKELNQKLILKHFENEKKEQERQKKREEEEKAREAARQRRAEEQKNALLYGPKKASKSSGSSSHSQSREGGRRKRLSDDEDDMSPAVALTREELREKKLQAQLKRSMGGGRSSLTRTYQKPGARLRGGAVDLQTPHDVGSSSTGMSVRERLASMPNTLTKLNANKRDTRTIDEIVQDIAKAKELKTLDGDEAKTFTDWFGDSKKDKTKSTSTASPSRANTPLSSSSPLGGTNSVKPPVGSNVKYPAPVVKTPLTKSVAKTNFRSASLDRERSTTKTSSKTSTAFSSQRSSAPAPSFKKKRPRSPSPERYPAKRRHSPPTSSRHKRRELSEELDDVNVSNMIWQIMGKKRSDYVRKDDIFSDEEDMEAGASDLEREEKRSSFIAKREDLLEQEAERRHEDEKRRRKKDRGY